MVLERILNFEICVQTWHQKRDLNTFAIVYKEGDEHKDSGLLREEWWRTILFDGYLTNGCISTNRLGDEGS